MQTSSRSACPPIYVNGGPINTLSVADARDAHAFRAESLSGRTRALFLQEWLVFKVSSTYSVSQADLLLLAAYVPVKAVVDGNLCEEFKSLSLQKQSAIAAELDRTVMEVGKKLEQIRTLSGF